MNASHFSWMAGSEKLGCLGDAVSDISVTTRNDDEESESESESESA